VTQPVYDFSERVVVVTGGSRGVGAGIVAAFAAAGAHVVACGRHEAEVDGAIFVAADIRKPPEAERVIAKAVEHFGRLDILINNAGGSPRALAADASPRFVEAIVNLNLLAPLWCAQSAHKVMAVQEDGGSTSLRPASISRAMPPPMSPGPISSCTEAGSPLPSWRPWGGPEGPRERAPKSPTEPRLVAFRHASASRPFR
jgi:NAD(P)-dependent dehydrogenase (short-subunit alcohol dehydrogenase family)